MSSWKAYIAPIERDGSYGEFIDVTSYIIGSDVGNTRRKTEKDEYDIGIAPNGSVKFKFNNSDGSFSEAGETGSIFTHRRGGSILKMTYLFGLYEPICGVAIAGKDVLGPEIDGFEGFISERDLNQDIIEDTMSITVLSFESLFKNLETSTTGINLSMTLSDVFYTLLNRSDITNLFTVNQSNFNLTFNPVLSSVNTDSLFEYFTDTALDEALGLVLEASASILYIENRTIYITDRVANDGVKYYFYGQASNFGLENIQNISDYKSGLSRTFNFWRWSDTDLISKDQSSIDSYGIMLHDDLSFDMVTESSARQLLLNTYRDEFSVPKKELRLSTFVNVEALGLMLFDKVSIDYPNVPIPMGAGALPVWNTGSMVWQDENNFNKINPYFTWPDGLLNIEIEPIKEWKIIGIEISTKKDLITFDLREV